MRQIKYFICAALILLSHTLGAQVTTTPNEQPSAAQPINQFSAEYHAFRFGKNLGTAKMKLEKNQHDHYMLTFDSHLSLFFLSDKRSETSIFSVENDKIEPISYYYRQSGVRSEKSLAAKFDKETKLITVNNNKFIPWKGELDNQLYRLDLQRRLAKGETEITYNIINSRGSLRQYKLKVMGKEQVEVPFGSLEGVKVKIMRESKKRETYAWFSPELDFTLVRLQQFKNGKEQGDIQLSQYNKK